jgi:hypothetical protein
MVDAVNCARHLLLPPQQQLPDELTRLLEDAVTVSEQDQLGKAGDLLQRAFEMAHNMAYV